MLDLGAHMSRIELITLEVWDYDSGAELNDDFVGGAKMNVPFCSMFSTDMVQDTVECAATFTSFFDDCAGMLGAEELEPLVHQLLDGVAWPPD